MRQLPRKLPTAAQSDPIPFSPCLPPTLGHDDKPGKALAEHHELMHAKTSSRTH
jgi:hypothetical protein